MEYMLILLICIVILLIKRFKTKYKNILYIMMFCIVALFLIWYLFEHTLMKTMIVSFLFIVTAKGGRGGGGGEEGDGDGGG